MAARKYAKQEAAFTFEVEHLEIARLVVDHVSYQSPLNASRSRKMAEAFDDIMAGVLHVNRRANGHLYVVDGQHRLEAMRIMGRKFAPCAVYNGLTIQQEAYVWWKVNTERWRKPNHYLFNGRLTAKDPVALDIEDSVVAHGFHRTTGGDDRRGLKAIAALERIYEWGGRSLLDQVLDILNGVWRDDENAKAGIAMQGLGFFLHRYQTEANFDRPRLLDILATRPITEIIKKQRAIQQDQPSQGTDTAATAFCKALREFFNTRLSAPKKLPPIALAKGGK